MKFYENKNNRHKFSKENFKGKPYIHVVKRQEYPIFFPGDLVGIKFSSYYKHDGIVSFSRYNVKSGKVEYIVRLNDLWDNTSVFEKKDLYLKPLTRKVLFEKYSCVNYNKDLDIKITFSGTSIFNSFYFGQ